MKKDASCEGSAIDRTHEVLTRETSEIESEESGAESSLDCCLLQKEHFECVTEADDISRTR